MIAAYFGAALAMAGLDLIWLSQLGDRLYRANLNAVMAAKLASYPAAVLFYLIYVAGIVYFAVRPALGTQDWRAAVIGGILFGFFCYMTYDLTNLATLKLWSVKVAIIDILWGCAVTGAAALAGYMAVSLLQ